MKKKRIVIISDLHCGSLVGLTHPNCCKLNRHDEELRKIQEAIWEFYSTTIRSLGKIDYLVVNGDSIEGKAKKNGGNEVMTTSLIEQVDMAKLAIEHAQADKYLIVGGTDYHVSENGENFEKVLAKQMGKGTTFTLGGHFKFEFDGTVYPTVFNFRHYMGSRQWNTRSGQLKRYLNNDMVEVAKGDRDELTNVLIRSHIHCFDYVKGIRHDTIAISSPALQSRGTYYGNTKCDGEYDIGFIEFNVTKDGTWMPIYHIAKIPSLRDKTQII